MPSAWASPCHHLWRRRSPLIYLYCSKVTNKHLCGTVSEIYSEQITGACLQIEQEMETGKQPAERYMYALTLRNTAAKMKSNDSH